MNYNTEIPVKSTLEDELLELIKKSNSFKLLCKSLDDKQPLEDISLKLEYRPKESERKLVHISKGTITREPEGRTANKRYKEENREKNVNLSKEKTTIGKEYFRGD